MPPETLSPRGRPTIRPCDGSGAATTGEANDANESGAEQRERGRFRGYRDGRDFDVNSDVRQLVGARGVGVGVQRERVLTGFGGVKRRTAVGEV